MYLARFSYDVLPVNRQRAIEFILRDQMALSPEQMRNEAFDFVAYVHGG